MTSTGNAEVRLIANPPRFHSRVSPENPSPVGSLGVTSKTGEYHSRQASNRSRGLSAWVEKTCGVIVGADPHCCPARAALQKLSKQRAIGDYLSRGFCHFMYITKPDICCKLG